MKMQYPHLGQRLVTPRVWRLRKAAPLRARRDRRDSYQLGRIASKERPYALHVQSYGIWARMLSVKEHTARVAVLHCPIEIQTRDVPLRAFVDQGLSISSQNPLSSATQ